MADEAQGAQSSQDQSAPWSADLAQRFPDEATRQQVDAYLREVQQPRMTQLEQQASQYKTELVDAEQALGLWKGFEENPGETFFSVTSQLFDEETANKILSMISDDSNPQGQQQAAQVVADASQQAAQQAQMAQPPALAPEYKELLDRLKQQDAETQYYKAIDDVLANPANKDLDGDLLRENIHPFVAATEGDFDAAVVRYRAMVSRFGPPATDTDIAAHNAPPVLDGQGAATNGAPVTRKYTLDEAIKETFDELKANAQRPAPPVGVA
jgi:hypothetical protein